MKINVVLLMGVVAVLLSACGGGLQSEPVTLETQRVDRCSYQGKVYGFAHPYPYAEADMSAQCYIILDGYDTVRAYASIEKAPSQNGPWTAAGASFPVPRSPTTNGYIKFEHLKVRTTLCGDTRAYWFRGKLRITWTSRNSTNVRGSTLYYTPKRAGHCN